MEAFPRDTISLKNRSVVVNTVAQFIGRTGSSALIFISTLILARLLGSANFGEYTKITTFLAIFYVIVDLGMNPVFLHLAAKRQFHHYGAFLTLRLLWGLVLGAVAMVGIWLLTRISGGYTHTTQLGVIVGSGAIAGYAVSLTATVIFQVRRRYDLAAFSQILSSATVVVLLAFLSKNIASGGERGVAWAVFVLVLGTWVSAGSSLWLSAKHQSSPVWQIDTRLWQNLIKRSLPLGVTLIFNSIYLRASILILAAHRPNAEVGAYGLAYKFFEFAIAPATFFMNSMYPQLLTKTGDYLRQGMRAVVVELTGVALAITLMVWIVSPLLALVLSDFAHSVYLLRFLSLWIPLFFLTSPLMFLAVILKRQLSLLHVYLVAMCLNISLNLVFVPTYGTKASVIATGVTEVIVLASGWLILLKK